MRLRTWALVYGVIIVGGIVVGLLLGYLIDKVYLHTVS